MKWKDEILRMNNSDGCYHFFNPALIIDILVCETNFQVTTANREFFTFPIELNQSQIETFVGQKLIKR
jgi:hypothetical protein